MCTSCEGRKGVDHSLKLVKHSKLWTGFQMTACLTETTHSFIFIIHIIIWSRLEHGIKVLNRVHNHVSSGFFKRCFACKACDKWRKRLIFFYSVFYKNFACSILELCYRTLWLMPNQVEVIYNLINPLTAILKYRFHKVAIFMFA